ncbi:Recombination endonuclease VII [uncultured Caudovirales phage]|uniref:Recombination endonuclease VII n=1 Tax=uncultured Caudovirales phage TaxID=2100421 RepID=A0A6J5KY21_9CAUD|nr:Recombination endonuclease VII [uncultured Caudovirales phage]CAB4132623.1 Recombination endonuclease VII [uncultured Caudovirales phage]CAB4202294.1 Recombination endonuclease VII [uncultured Caudovirales phage]CAB5207210.1 Recombination endonuclease VII [uncultured Caudovirales phage]
MEKICKIHGDLPEQDIQIEKIKYKTKDGEVRESQQYRCRICRREKDMKYKHAHKEERLAYNQKWRSENRERVNANERRRRTEIPEKYKEWARNQRERLGELWSLRESTRLRNISIEQYNKMHEQQKGLCAICQRENTQKSRKKGEICRLAIDHCHETGKVRGLLCGACNKGLGHFEDDIELLLTAIIYLEAHKHIE